MSGFTWEGLFGIRRYPDWLDCLLHHNLSTYLDRRAVIKQLERVATTDKQKRQQRHEKHLSTQRQYEAMYGINQTAYYYDPEQSLMTPSEIDRTERVSWPSLHDFLARKAVEWGSRRLEKSAKGKAKATDSTERLVEPTCPHCHCRLPDPSAPPNTSKPLPNPPSDPLPRKSRRTPPPLIPKNATLPFEPADYNQPSEPEPRSWCRIPKCIKKLREEELDRKASLDAREAAIEARERDYLVGKQPIARDRHPAETVRPYYTQSAHRSGGKRDNTTTYPAAGTGFQTVPGLWAQTVGRDVDDHDAARRHRRARDSAEPEPKVSIPVVETRSEYDRRHQYDQGQRRQQRGRDHTRAPTVGPRERSRSRHRSRSRPQPPPAPFADEHISSYYPNERQLNRDQQRLADERAEWKERRRAEQRSYDFSMDLGPSSKPTKTPSPDDIRTPHRGRSSAEPRQATFGNAYRRRDPAPRSRSPVDDDPFDEHVFRHARETTTGYEARPTRLDFDESVPRARPSGSSRPRPGAVLVPDDEYDCIRSIGDSKYGQATWDAMNEARHRRRNRSTALADDLPSAPEVGARSSRPYALRMSCEKQNAAQWADNVEETVRTRTQRESHSRETDPEVEEAIRNSLISAEREEQARSAWRRGGYFPE